MKRYFAPLLAAALLSAQNPTDSSAVFQSQTREVLLEVVVRDAHGKLVTKIDPSQVTVYEDGVKQEIKSFKLIPGREVRAAITKEAEWEKMQSSALPAPKAPDVRPRSNPLRTVNIVCLVLNDINQYTRTTAYKAAREFVDKELRPDTFIGVFSLDATGLRLVFPFSNSREHLVKAIQLASTNQLPTVSQSVAAALNGISATVGVSSDSGVTSTVANGATVTTAPTPGVPTNADGSSVKDPLGARGDMGLAVNAGLREIDALITLVKQLGQLPFQKTVLLMSTGLTRPPDQLEYWNSLISSANKNGVTFYGLDVYGLAVCQDCGNGDVGGPSTPTGRAGQAIAGVAAMSRGQSSVGLNPGSTTGTSPTAQLMESMHQTDYLRFGVLSANAQEALREISESTGGFVISNTNNTEALLEKVMEDVDTHYELAYRPAAPTNDGHFRKIEVKVAARTGLSVQTRSGYYAVPETSAGPLTPGDMGALEALDAKPLPHTFDFNAKAYRFRPAQGTTQYSIAWEVPIANLTATADEKEKRHRFHAYLLALVKNERGEIVERVSRDVPSEIADNVLPALRSDSMIYEHAVNLSPGRYTIETAVVDQEGNRASTDIFEIDNRAQAGLAISDIALLRRVNPLDRAPDPTDPFEIPGKRGQPLLSNTLPANVQPYIYFVAYPEKGDAQLRAEFWKNGQVVAVQKSALPSPDSTGAVPMAIQPAAGPGDYEVRVTVEQDERKVQRTVKYSIAN
jgi:VWFA-related protein